MIASFSAECILFGCIQARWLQPCSDYFSNFVAPFCGSFFPSPNDLWEWPDISQTDQSELREKFSFVKYKKELFSSLLFIPIHFYSLSICGSFLFSGYSVRGVFGSPTTVSVNKAYGSRIGQDRRIPLSIFQIP